MDCIIVALVFTLQCLGVLSGNILTGKSSVQSSTYQDFLSQHAIDSDTETYSFTDKQPNPYWQCDLGGYVNVTNITVTSINTERARYLRDAIIEIATSSISTSPEMGSTFTCGRWPDAYRVGETITFYCSHSPVQYVRIRREVTDFLSIAEVKAEGVPFISPGVLSGNILTGKSSVQSSDYNCNFPSQHAIDGDTGTYGFTGKQSNPYWQCDLGGLFNVTKITVTNTNDGIRAEQIRGAIIEISTTSISTCPEMGSTFICGRWPDLPLSGETIAFNCSHSPVRYVRIRREVVNERLSLAEVEAEGVPGIPPGGQQQYFDKIKSKKVTTPIKSLSVGKVTECGTMCSRNQPCVAFSFSKSQQPNCLLAVDTSMTTDDEWLGYKFNECVKMPTTCPPIG